ncbi:unnamed protein product [Mesocestoides corti]|uniref:Uncharacterized protein n=1 Tax=Mesocestoides corti TaxID=53468 RepID=A0A0R3UIA8_MESCO|nr:unnamed protein product [Mesocestoides corti]
MQVRFVEHPMHSNAHTRLKDTDSSHELSVNQSVRTLEVRNYDQPCPQLRTLTHPANRELALRCLRSGRSGGRLMRSSIDKASLTCLHTLMYESPVWQLSL